LLFELGKAKVSPLPSRSTIYRVLVRHGLVLAAGASAAAGPGSPGEGDVNVGVACA
jgi:hypothetical protein